jgi:F-type H+-transporting ATPase subunit alpha
MSVPDMAVTLFAVNRGYMDDVEVNRALAFESALLSFLKGKYKALLDKIDQTNDLDAEAEKALIAAIEDFKASAAY